LPGLDKKKTLNLVQITRKRLLTNNWSDLIEMKQSSYFHILQVYFFLFLSIFFALTKLFLLFGD